MIDVNLLEGNKYENTQKYKHAYYIKRDRNMGYRRVDEGRAGEVLVDGLTTRLASLTIEKVRRWRD